MEKRICITFAPKRLFKSSPLGSLAPVTGILSFAALFYGDARQPLRMVPLLLVLAAPGLTSVCDRYTACD